jgi:Fic family protein
MLFQAPKLTEEDASVLDLIAEQKERLRPFVSHEFRRWMGSISRAMFARAIQGSNTIEGYNVSLDEAVAAIEDEPPLDERTETWYAIKGYRDAMTYIIQTVKDPYFEISAQFLRSLHFMMLQYDMSKNPGRWRPGSGFVVSTKTGQTVYDAPDVEMVNDLIGELISYLTSARNEPAIVRAAMAHLNFTMIHPFSDGNGRLARALQTLVLAREGMLHPTFSSIEEWLGANVEEYYDVLGLVGQGKWNPDNDAMPWVRFCFKAHFQQAAKFIRRVEEADGLYNKVTDLIKKHGLPERMWFPMFEAALGIGMTNSRYRKNSETELTEFTASRDLKRLCEVGLLLPHGERKMRTYSAAPILTQARAAVRIKRVVDDPYEVIKRRFKKRSAGESPRLPGF